jgi:small multidrug resistance pump
MWKRWVLLIGAIVAEVLGTISLRAAIDEPLFTIGVVIGYLVAFTLLGLALGQGIPVGIAYGIWAAAGVALVAVLGAIIFGETLSLTSIIGLMIIVAGVFIVQTGQRESVKTEVLES